MHFSKIFNQITTPFAVTLGVLAIAAGTTPLTVPLINKWMGVTNSPVKTPSVMDKAAVSLAKGEGYRLTTDDYGPYDIYETNGKTALGVYFASKPDAPKNALGMPLTIKCTTNMAAPTTGPVEMAGNAKCFIVKMG